MAIPTAAFPNIDTPLFQEIWKAFEEEREKRIRDIEDIYGRLFSNIIGKERLFNIPCLYAEDVHLEKDDKYPSIKLEALKEHSAIRGITGSQRPFIAIKVEILNEATHEVEDVYPELICKRYPIDGDGRKGGDHEDNYITAVSTVSQKGKTYTSKLYSTGGMSEVQMEAVRDLLKGKEIKSPFGKDLIRKA